MCRDLNTRDDSNSDVQFPISLHGRLLSFLLTQEESQGCSNNLWALTKLLRQIVHADHYIAAWIACMDFATISRNPISELPDFFPLILFCPLIAVLTGFQIRPTHKRYP